MTAPIRTGHADITYIPMRRGLLYLVAAMDGRGRWIDNLRAFGRTDGAPPSIIERLWRSLKYECVYISAFETGSELRAGLTRSITY